MRVLRNAVIYDLIFKSKLYQFPNSHRRSSRDVYTQILMAMDFHTLQSMHYIAYS